MIALYAAAAMLSGGTSSGETYTMYAEWVRFDTTTKVISAWAPGTGVGDCESIVYFKIGPNGEWIWQTGDCRLPCTQGCFFCMDVDGGWTTWWCACSSVGCGETPEIKSVE